MWWGGGGAKSPNKVSFPKFWWWAVSKIGFTKHIISGVGTHLCSVQVVHQAMCLVFWWAPNLDTPDCVLLICAALHVKPTGLAGGVALLVPLLFVALLAPTCYCATATSTLDEEPLPPTFFGRSSNFHWTICCCHCQSWSSMSWHKYSSGQSPLNLHGV